MAAATLAAMVIVPAFLCLILQTAYYWTTYKEETIYLSQSEEIYPDDNIWGAGVVIPNVVIAIHLFISGSNRPCFIIFGTLAIAVTYFYRT